MVLRRPFRGRWLWPALGAVLFLVIFLFVVSLTMPGDVILSALRPPLARSGLDISAASSRLEFPLSFRMDNAVIGRPGGKALPLDRITAGWEWTGLLAWLPFHATVTAGKATADLRASPLFWNPGRGRITIEHLDGESLSPLVPLSAAGTGFFLDSAVVRWRKTSSGEISGTGTGRFDWVRIPIPEPSSPVREALLTDVTVLFAIRDRALVVSSFEGTYEGARVEGTGEITEVLSPLRSTVTFHLRIENPLEGKIATIFDLLAKNAKNATLRITGALLSPAGEFHFF